MNLLDASGCLALIATRTAKQQQAWVNVALEATLGAPAASTSK